MTEETFCLSFQFEWRVVQQQDKVSWTNIKHFQGIIHPETMHFLNFTLFQTRMSFFQQNRHKYNFSSYIFAIQLKFLVYHWLSSFKKDKNTKKLNKKYSILLKN